MKDALCLLLAPRATLGSWLGAARKAEWAVLLAEWLAAAATAVGLTHILWGLSLRVTLALLAMPLLAMALTVVVRRLGWPGIIRPVQVPPPSDESEAAADRVEPVSAGQLRAARARVTLATGTFLLALWVPALMAGMLRLGAFGMLAVLLGGGLILLLAGVWWHGELARLAGLSSQPGRFWGGYAAESAISLVLVGVLLAWPAGELTSLFRVPSMSMWPTLFGSEPGGDVILVDRTAWWSGEPQRFDVAVIDHPGYPTHLVKRIIGLGGDRVSLAGGNIWINGEVAVRPLDVQFSQLRREPVFRFAPLRDRARFSAQLPAERHPDSTPLTDAEREARIAAWPTDYSQRLAAWFGIEAGMLQPQTQPEGREPLLEIDWQPCEPRDVSNGIVLSQATAERLVLRQWPTDPALRDLRSTEICDDLALQMSLSMHRGVSVNVVLRITSGQRMAEHSFEVRQHVDAGAGPAMWCQGSGQLIDENGEVACVEVYTGPTLADPGGKPVTLRVQNIDGVWDLWLNDRRADPRQTRTPMALPAGTTNVSLTILASGPTVIHTLLLNTPTHYIDFGQLGSGATLTVPGGQYLLLGDHPIFTTDSRNWEAMEVRWADGRRELMSLDAETPSQMSTVPTPDNVPADLELPGPLADDFWIDDRRRELTFLGVMTDAQRDTLLAASSDSGWQAAIRSLCDASQQVPAFVGLVPSPFIPRDRLVGRVEAVVAPLDRIRLVR